MEEEKALYYCRIEELPFLGALIFLSFSRDKSDFIKFSPEYDDPYSAEFSATVKVVEELVAPVKLVSEMKKITERLGNHFTHARNMTNKLKRYVEKAINGGSTLTMAVEDFGFKALRNQIYLKNDEGVVKDLRILKKNLADNLTALVPRGYSAEVQAELDTLITDLSTDSVAQTAKKKQIEQLVKDNMGELNKLWLKITDLLKSGKTIFLEKDKSKLKDYNYSKIIKDVQKRRKEEEAKAKADSKKAEEEVETTGTPK